jgi:hypothetical protein
LLRLTYCRIAKAFLERLDYIAKKMRGMLAEVRAEAKVMIRAHQKHGGLFTVDPGQRSSASAELSKHVNGLVTADSILTEPMTAPVMALSLLSNTSCLVDHGVLNLTLPRLPLMFPGDAAAQEKCLIEVNKVWLLPSLYHTFSNGTSSKLRRFHMLGLLKGSRSSGDVVMSIARTETLASRS